MADRLVGRDMEHAAHVEGEYLCSELLTTGQERRALLSQSWRRALTSDVNINYTPLEGDRKFESVVEYRKESASEGSKPSTGACIRGIR